MRTFRLTLAALLVAAPALAIGGPGRPGGFGPGHGPGRGPGFGPGFGIEERLDRLAEILDLDESQRAAFEQLRAEHRDAARPKLERMRALHQELDALLDSGSNDAAAIGGKMIALRGLRDELRAEREAGEAELVKLLTPEQRIAFETLKEARESMRERGPGDGPGFGARRGGPGVGRR
jgi:Spy/CpxP family protein refolding chaperone